MNSLSSEAFITFVVAFAVFTDSMIYDMVIPFLPELFEERLHIPSDQVAIWSALSLETFGIAMLVSTGIVGYFIDSVTSKSRPFVFAMAVMLASTLLFFVTSQPALILLARALQGTSTSLVWVAGTAFLSSQISRSAMPLAMSYITLGETMGELFGPLLGGLVYEHFGHWAVCGAVEVFVVADVVLRLLLKEKHAESSPKQGSDEESTRERDDLLPVQYEETSYGATERQWTNEGGSSSSSHGSCISILHQHENVYDEDCAAMASLTQARWTWFTSFASSIAVATTRCGLEAFLPMNVHELYSWNSSASGFLMFALLSPMILSPLIGKCTATSGPGWWSIASFGICGCVLLSLPAADDNHNVFSQIVMLAQITLIGACLAFGTVAHSIAMSVAAQDATKVFDRTRCGDRSWWSCWLTPGIMVSGIAVAWGVGMLFGPAVAGAFKYTEPKGLLKLCYAFAGINALTAVGNAVLYRTNVPESCIQSLVQD